MRALTIVAGFGLACCALTGRATGDAGVSARTLAGTWALVSIYEENEVGEDMDRWGDAPTGRFIADTSGHFMLQVVGRNVIRLGVSERACGNKGYEGIAYAGRLAVDRAGAGVALTIDDALSNAFDHSRRTASITLAGEHLDFISSAEMSPSGAFFAHIRWKRVQ